MHVLFVCAHQVENALYCNLAFTANNLMSNYIGQSGPEYVPPFPLGTNISCPTTFNVDYWVNQLMGTVAGSDLTVSPSLH